MHIRVYNARQRHPTGAEAAPGQPGRTHPKMCTPERGDPTKSPTSNGASTSASTGDTSSHAPPPSPPLLPTPQRPLPPGAAPSECECRHCCCCCSAAPQSPVPAPARPSPDHTLTPALTSRSRAQLNSAPMRAFASSACSSSATADSCSSRSDVSSEASRAYASASVLSAASLAAWRATSALRTQRSSDVAAASCAESCAWVVRASGGKKGGVQGSNRCRPPSQAVHACCVRRGRLGPAWLWAGSPPALQAPALQPSKHQASLCSPPCSGF